MEVERANPQGKKNSATVMHLLGLLFESRNALL